MAALLLGATLQAQEKTPNILMIVSEDNGPELGSYGDPYVRTPTLDSLAASGIRFENAFVPYSVCSPSRACFYTGLLPHQNGQLGLATHKYQMYQNYPWLGSYLKKQGYRTGMIGKLHVNPESAFEVDYRAIRGANFHKQGRDMTKYAAAASEFINQGEEPFFLAINYPDAHFPLHDQAFGIPEHPLGADDVKVLPWVGADSERLRTQMAAYYNCMERLDHGVNLLFEELRKSGKLENTIIIYFGDHGAQFSRGKATVYEAGLRIPMLVSWPDHIKSNTVIEELVSTIDIFPTVIEATGNEVPDYLPGIAWQKFFDGKDKGGHEYITGITTGSAPGIYTFSISFRDKQYKLIWNPHPEEENHLALAYEEHRNQHFEAGTTKEEMASSTEQVQKAYKIWEKQLEFELYDLESDPYEWNNLSENPKYARELKRMKKALKKWQEKYNDPFADPEELEFFLNEQRQYIHTMDYRKDKSFKWQYVDEFAPFAPKAEQ